MQISITISNMQAGCNGIAPSQDPIALGVSAEWWGNLRQLTYGTRTNSCPSQCQRTVRGSDGPLAWESSGP